MKIIRNDRPEPISVGRPPALSRSRIISVVVRFAVVVLAVLVVLGVALNR